MLAVFFFFFFFPLSLPFGWTYFLELTNMDYCLERQKKKKKKQRHREILRNKNCSDRRFLGEREEVRNDLRCLMGLERPFCETVKLPVPEYSVTEKF